MPGSSALGFIEREVYNNLAKEDIRILEGGDAKHLGNAFEVKA